MGSYLAAVECSDCDGRGEIRCRDCDGDGRCSGCDGGREIEEQRRKLEEARRWEEEKARRQELEEEERARRQLEEELYWAEVEAWEERQARLRLIRRRWGMPLTEVRRGMTVYKSLIASGNYRGALDVLKRMEKTSSQPASIYGSMGWCEYLLGHIRASISRSSKAVQLDPTLAWVWYNLGLAFLARGDQGRAREAYLMALEADRHKKTLPSAKNDLLALVTARPNLRAKAQVGLALLG